MSSHVVLALLAVVVAILGVLLFARRLIRGRAASATPPASPARPDEEDEDEPWPNSWRLWWWYVTARKVAHRAGFDVVLRLPKVDDHIALDAAQVIGQEEGARLRLHPEACVPLLTAKELDKRVRRLLDDTDETPTKPIDVAAGRSA